MHAGFWPAPTPPREYVHVSEEGEKCMNSEKYSRMIYGGVSEVRGFAVFVDFFVRFCGFRRFFRAVLRFLPILNAVLRFQ